MAYSEDLFPSADKWDSQAENVYKQWPTTINPTSAEVNQSRLTFANYSHNGRKFTRRSSSAKWQINVNYDALTADQFTAMHAIVLAGQGQHNPYKFDIDYLFRHNSAATDTITLANSIQLGQNTIEVSGLPVNTANAVKKGEIIEVTNRNGSINLVLATVDSDSNGEATLILAYPATQTLNTGTVLNRKLQHVVVTLASNNFEYTVDETGFYNVSVTFDLDEFK